MSGLTPIINDLDQVIGEYRLGYPNDFKPFFWENGRITEMGIGSELCHQIEAQGYHVMNIKLKALNNNGNIAGIFEYGKFNSKKNVWVKIGALPFFWNGFAHIINIDNYKSYSSIYYSEHKLLTFTGFKIMFKAYERFKCSIITSSHSAEAST